MKKYGLYIKLTPYENDIIVNIRKKYSMNLSQYLRKQIVKLYKKLQNKLGNEL